MLAAEGVVEARRGSGFFVKEAVPEADGEATEGHTLRRTMDIVWLLRTQLRNEPGQLAVGDAFPPSEWLAGAEQAQGQTSSR